MHFCQIHSKEWQKHHASGYLQLFWPDSKQYWLLGHLHPRILLDMALDTLTVCFT